MDPQQINNEQQAVDINNLNVAQPQADVRTNRAAFYARFSFYRGVPPLGEGTYGRVYRARNTVQGNDVAIKMFVIERNNNDQLQSFLRELDILMQMGIDNGHTVPFVIWHHIEQRISPSFLVLGVMWRTLGEEVRRRRAIERSLSLDEIRALGRQIVNGLAFLAKLDIIHADLKPGNIMFTNEVNNQLRIIDFGHAFVRTNYNDHPIQTAEYRAMEVFLERGLYTNAIDIWSFGCILAFMHSGRDLFASSIDRERKIVHQMVRTLGMPPANMLNTLATFRYFEYDNGQWKRKLLWLWEMDGIEPYRRDVEQQLLLNVEQQQSEQHRNFVDLINQTLDYNANRRINLARIGDHAFFNPRAPRR